MWSGGKPGESIKGLPIAIEWISKLLGKETRVVQNISYSKQGGNTSLNRTGVELYTPAQLRTMPEDECIIIPKSLDAFKGKKFMSDKHPQRALVKQLEKDTGGYWFNPQKAADLLEEHRNQEQAITDAHGDIDEGSEDEQAMRNEAADQAAREYAANEDAGGKPIVGKPRRVRMEGEGLDDTLKPSSKEGAKASAEATINTMEDVWGVDEIMYGSAPAAAS